VVVEDAVGRCSLMRWDTGRIRTAGVDRPPGVEEAESLVGVATSRYGGHCVLDRFRKR